MGLRALYVQEPREDAPPGQEVHVSAVAPELWLRALHPLLPGSRSRAVHATDASDQLSAKRGRRVRLVVGPRGPNLSQRDPQDGLDLSLDDDFESSAVSLGLSGCFWIAIISLTIIY